MNFIPIRIQQKVPQYRNKRYSSYDSFNRIAVILAQKYGHILREQKNMSIFLVYSNQS